MTEKWKKVFARIMLYNLENELIHELFQEMYSDKLPKVEDFGDDEEAFCDAYNKVFEDTVYPIFEEIFGIKVSEA